MNSNNPPSSDSPSQANGKPPKNTFWLIIALSIIIVLLLLALIMPGLQTTQRSGVGQPQTNQPKPPVSVATPTPTRRQQTTPTLEPTATRTPRPIHTPGPTSTPTPDPCLQTLDTVTYDDLYRYIERHEGEIYQFTVGVFQALYDLQSPSYLVSMAYDEFIGLYNHVYMTTNQQSRNMPSRLLEGDIITFCGMPAGLYQYETVEGTIAEVPHVLMLMFFKIE